MQGQCSLAANSAHQLTLGKQCTFWTFRCTQLISPIPRDITPAPTWAMRRTDTGQTSLNDLAEEWWHLLAPKSRRENWGVRDEVSGPVFELGDFRKLA